jgi:hypothetical protein
MLFFSIDGQIAPKRIFFKSFTSLIIDTKCTKALF